MSHGQPPPLFPVLLLGLLLAACQDPGAGDRLAQVGDVAITIEKYNAYYEDLPEKLKSEKPGIDGHREHLQSMIDRELLLMEARATGLDRDPDYLRRQRKRLEESISQLYHKKLMAELAIAPGELRRFFHDSGRDREFMLEVVEFQTLPEAREALEKIRAGAGFESFRGEGAEPTAVQRRLEGRYFGPDFTGGALQDIIFSLELNEVSEPVWFGRSGGLVKVVAERSLPFDGDSKSLRQHYRQEMFRGERRRHLEELSRKYRSGPVAEGLDRLFQEAAAAGRDGVSRETVIWEFDGGGITAGRLLDQLANRGKSEIDLGDTSLVMPFLRDFAVPAELVLAEAGGLGMDAPVRSRFAENRDRGLAEELLERAVKRPVSVTREEAEAYFEEHPEFFRGSEIIRVREILVETEAEARDLLRRLRDGADFPTLASEHTLRAAGRKNRGEFHFHPHEKPRYPGLVEAAATAPLDRLQGPLAVEGGYSIFTVLGHEREEKTFEDKRVEFKAGTMVRKLKENNRFDQFTTFLRERYADRVTIFEDNLRQVAGKED